MHATAPESHADKINSGRMLGYGWDGTSPTSLVGIPPSSLPLLLLTRLAEGVYDKFAAPPPRGPTTEGSPVVPYGAVSRNDVVLLHRLAMCRIRSLLGVCGLLQSAADTDETLGLIEEARNYILQARSILEDVCPYDTPLVPEGIF